MEWMEVKPIFFRKWADFVQKKIDLLAFFGYNTAE